MLYWVWVPETKSVPLEELAVIFGDTDEVKILSQDIFLNDDREAVVEDHHSVQEVMAKDQPTVALREKA